MDKKGKIEKNININLTEQPLCRFSQRKNKTYKTIRTLIEEAKDGNAPNSVVAAMKSLDETLKGDMHLWIDSNGNNKAILMTTSDKYFPNAFAMETFYAIIGLYMHKNPPILSPESNKYIISTNELEFSFYELSKYMKLSCGGVIYEKLKSAIRELYRLDLYSLESGAFFDQKTNSFVKLIYKYDISKINNDNKYIKCRITLGDLVLNNITNNYFRYLDYEVFFNLKSGITRRLYSYIKGNKRPSTKYLKRNLATLNRLLPLDCSENNKIISKLEPALKRLVENNIISDYFFGNKIIIDNKKEYCLYILFNNFTRADLIKHIQEKKEEKLNKKNKKNKKINEPKKINLVYPTDFELELRLLGISPESKIHDILLRFRDEKRYELAEYIIWINELISNGNVSKSPAGLFMFAITPNEEFGNNVIVKNTHPHISEFVDSIKEKECLKKAASKKDIKKEYEKYIKKEISKFKNEENNVYEIIYNNTLLQLESIYKKKIKSLETIINDSNIKENKDNLINMHKEFMDFEIFKEKSILFNAKLTEAIKVFKKLLSFEDFKKIITIYTT